jgi:hypothetical protein
MINNDIILELVDVPTQAPYYGEDFKMLKMVRGVVVGKGTIKGKPTIDIQLVDQDGNKYLVMATGGLLEMIAAAIRGKRMQSGKEN